MSMVSKPWKPLRHKCQGEFLENTPFYASGEFPGIPPLMVDEGLEDISPDGKTELTTWEDDDR